jgi:hypothetical protein
MVTLIWPFVFWGVFGVNMIHQVAFVVGSSKITVGTSVHNFPLLLVLAIIIGTCDPGHSIGRRQYFDFFPGFFGSIFYLTKDVP